MSSTGEVALEIMMLVFVGCGIIGVVGCVSALLKKCYDKYVLNLPDEPEISMEIFQNLEGRYAKAAVSVGQEIDLVEVCVCGSEPDELVETNIIAEEILAQDP